MKKLKTVVSIAVLFCICAALTASKCSIGPGQHKTGDEAKPSGNGFAVVELFTSEGCSSCPSADALVAKVQKEDAALPVYILAFHVDYWDRLGWKDVFSSAAYSKRQSQYASWLNLQSVYTPQVVVNGKKEFVGSQESTLRNTIKDDLQKAASAKLTLNDIAINQQQVSVKYATENTAGNVSLFLAVVQKSATTKVEHGENGGRTLAHVQVVRGLQLVDLKKGNNGTTALELPIGLNQQDVEVIGFIQNNTTGEIIAAAKEQLKGEK